MKAVKIVHVVHSLATGGTEHGVVNVINALAGDFNHSVICMSGPGALAARLPAGVEVYRLGKRTGLDGRAFVRLVRLLRRLNPDLLHSRNWAAFDAVLAARLAGVPYVIHGEHGREAADPLGSNSRRCRARRLFAPIIDRFVTVSLDLRRWLVDRVGIRPSKVVTIHNGVDPQRFANQDREPARRLLGVAPTAPVIGTVGRLDPVKDHAGLLRAFARIAAARPHAVVVIVGDGPLRAATAALAAELGLGGRLKLLGERDDVPSLLAGFDVFALPSIAEGMSNTLLEAMASGLPIVATRVGGNPELVEDGVNGRLVPASDPAALAEALDDYLTDPLLGVLHGKASRQRAIEHFSLARMADAYKDLYLRTFNGNSRAAGVADAGGKA